jgi:hypothetical protein
MTVAQIMEALSDEQIMDRFLICFAEGIFNEWDCGFNVAMDQFGPAELAIAAKDGKHLAEREGW